IVSPLSPLDGIFAALEEHASADARGKASARGSRPYVIIGVARVAVDARTAWRDPSSLWTAFTCRRVGEDALRDGGTLPIIVNHGMFQSKERAAQQGNDVRRERLTG